MKTPFGIFYSSNITPDPETGIGTWTDGEKIRAIREGIDKYGKALFPMMPYEHFRHMVTRRPSMRCASISSTM